MWRVLYSPHKLSPSQRSQLSDYLADYTFTCGASLSDLQLPGFLEDVCVRDLRCYAPVENSTIQ